MAEEITERWILDDSQELSLPIEPHDVRLVPDAEILVEPLGHFLHPEGLRVMPERCGVGFRVRRKVERGADPEPLLVAGQDQIDRVHAAIVAATGLPSPTQTNHYR